MATLTVRGHAVVEVDPDHVELALVLTGVAASADEAYADVARRASALSALLDDLGVPPADRLTEGLALHEEPGYPDGSSQGEPRYRAWTRTRVRLTDADAIGPLIGRAVDRAGAGVEGVLWSVDREHPGRLEACGRAAEAARERAGAYADALGLPLGRVVAAVDAGAALPGETRMRGIAVHAGAPAYPADAGIAQVAAAIDVTFELGTDADG